MRFSLGGALEASEVGGGKMNFCGSDCKLFVLLDALLQERKDRGVKVNVT